MGVRERAFRQALQRKIDHAEEMRSKYRDGKHKEQKAYWDGVYTARCGIQAKYNRFYKESQKKDVRKG